MWTKGLKLSWLFESELDKNNTYSSSAIMLISVVLVQLPIILWATWYKPVSFFTLCIRVFRKECRGSLEIYKYMYINLKHINLCLWYIEHSQINRHDTSNKVGRGGLWSLGGSQRCCIGLGQPSRKFLLYLYWSIRYEVHVHAYVFDWLIKTGWLAFTSYFSFAVLAGRTVSLGIPRVIEQISRYYCWTHSKCINNKYIDFTFQSTSKFIDPWGKY